MGISSFFVLSNVAYFLKNLFICFLRFIVRLVLSESMWKLQAKTNDIILQRVSNQDRIIILIATFERRWKWPRVESTFRRYASSRSSGEIIRNMSRIFSASLETKYSPSSSSTSLSEIKRRFGTSEENESNPSCNLEKIKNAETIETIDRWK